LLIYGFLPVPASFFLLSAAMYAAVIQHFMRTPPLENKGDEFLQTAVNQMCTLQRKVEADGTGRRYFS
jgi:hypothetical protein